MSAGKTSAVQMGGGAEPEFFALSNSNVQAGDMRLTITAPKNVKTVCGIGLVYAVNSNVTAGALYPSSQSVNGSMVVINLLSTGTYGPGQLTVQGNQISWSTINAFRYVIGGYCCYIPE